MKQIILYVSQEQYIQKIINRFDLDRERISDIPMSPHAKFTFATETEDLINVTQYRSAIGSLMYAAIELVRTSRLL